MILGSHLANNQPVTTKYLCYAKRQGTRIVVVNPMREPGLERYWVPSDLRSALFGTRLMDDFFQVAVGGDIAFLNGVLKHLIERGWTDRDVRRAPHQRLRRCCAAHVAALVVGAARAARRARPRRHAALRRAVRARAKTRGVRLQHGAHPAPLRRRQREGAGQPGARARHARAREVRRHADPRALGRAGRQRVRRGSRQAIRAASRSRTTRTGSASRRCGARRSRRGSGTSHAPDAGGRAPAARSTSSTRWAATCSRPCPTAPTCSEALSRVTLRVHQDIVLNTSSLLPGRTGDPPAARRRATRRRAAAPRPAPSGASASRPRSRARASPRRARVARSRCEIAVAARPTLAPRLAWRGTAGIRAEMSRAMPLYAGIEHRARGPVGAVGRRASVHRTASRACPGGRARFTSVSLARNRDPARQVLPHHPAREAVQQHGPRAERLPDGQPRLVATC